LKKSNIIVEEIIRELSTIKVLGFFDQETTLYIYRGTIILSIIGILCGYLAYLADRPAHLHHHQPAARQRHV
jgi:ABC-type antimicrobial peptide transport system permease subunit